MGEGGAPAGGAYTQRYATEPSSSKALLKSIRNNSKAIYIQKCNVNKRMLLNFGDM